ncbi:hypothetical protein ES703_122935 [subsurface metagenome]
MSILHISTRVIGRTVEETARLKAGHGELLTRPAWGWTWFGTFTFKEPITISGANRDWNRFVQELNAIRFGKRYRARGETITYAMAIEYQKRGVPHLHALMGLTGRLNQFDAMKIWEQCGSLIMKKSPVVYIRPKPLKRPDGVIATIRPEDARRILHPRTGYARIYEYDPLRGGLEYIIKYVGKRGEITVHCSQKTGLALQLRPSVDGPGLPQDFFLRQGTLQR